jgi:hypothetical protein
MKTRHFVLDLKMHFIIWNIFVIASTVIATLKHSLTGIVLLSSLVKFSVDAANPTARMKVGDEPAIGIKIEFYCWNMRRRFFAIFWSLWFSILPWQAYEKECHYKEWGYWYHLFMNIGYAFKWFLFLETEDDIRFEKEVNGN